MSLIASVQSPADAAIGPGLVIAAVVALGILAAIFLAHRLASHKVSRSVSRALDRDLEHLGNLHDPRTCDCEATR